MLKYFLRLKPGILSEMELKKKSFLDSEHLEALKILWPLVLDKVFLWIKEIIL